MGMWGGVWFGIFALVTYVVGIDDFYDIFIYAILGFIAATHWEGILKEHVKKWQWDNNKNHQNNIAAFERMRKPISNSDSTTTRPSNVSLPTNIPNPIPIPSTSTAPINVSTTTPTHSSSTTAYRANRIPAKPPERPAPLLDQFFTQAQQWLLGGNTVVRVGVLILFIGLAFLAKYTAQLGLFPIEARLSIVAFAGLILLSVGFIKRLQVPHYALTLQGAGIAVLYLTLLAAMRGYHLLPTSLAFALMVFVCAAGCMLAILQNSMTLAMVSFAGGFAAPILLSTGSNNYVGLFSYYTILNIAILFIASQRTWRPLHLLGFFATFGVASTWGILRYQPEHYVPAQCFLIIFFSIYLLTALFYARNTAQVDTLHHMPLVDSILIFGTPLIGFGLQVGLVQSFAYGAAFSALALASLYVVLAYSIVKQTRGYNALLLECFIVLAIGFITIAIPLALDNHWITVAWAVEGLAAFWVGMRQARWVPRALGLALQGLAALAWLNNFEPYTTYYPFLNPTFLNAGILIFCAFTLAYWLQKPMAHSNSQWAITFAKLENQLAQPFYLYGLGTVLLAAALQWLLRDVHSDLFIVSDYVTRLFGLSTTLLSICTLSVVWGHNINRHAAHWAIYLFFPVLTLTALVLLWEQPLLQHIGWFFWPVSLMVAFYLLYRTQTTSGHLARMLPWGHAIGVWLLYSVLVQSIAWHVMHSTLVHTAWASVTLLTFTGIYLFALAYWAGRPHPHGFPLQSYQRAYLWLAAIPLAIIMLISIIVVATTSAGNTHPLPYIPLLNPTDLALAGGACALIFWRISLKKQAISTPQLIHSSLFWKATALLVFLLINTAWLRIAHHFFGVYWDAHALFASYIVQLGYAILWTILALITMVWAHRRTQRIVWMAGAGLLALTVLKLVLIDLANRGGFERIIAFIAVGGLMLVIGYLAPLPPTSSKESS